MTTTPEEMELVEVRILGLPLDLAMRASEHHEALRREFALIAHDSDPVHDVPARLLRLSRELEERFSRFTEESTAEREAAVAAGVTRHDQTMRLPPEVREATLEFEALLDEADEYCRRGDLLTLATPPELVMYRRWILHQVVDQTAGAPPVSWDEWVARSADGDEAG